MSDEEIVRTIVAARSPVLGTTDIANEFDISPQAMVRHLRRMVEDEKLETAKISDVNVWWPTTKGRQLLKGPDNEHETG